MKLGRICIDKSNLDNKYCCMKVNTLPSTAAALPKCARCKDAHQTKMHRLLALSPPHEHKDSSYFKEAEDGFKALEAARRKNRYSKTIANARNTEQIGQHSNQVIAFVTTMLSYQL